jgi:thioredoxin 1
MKPWIRWTILGLVAAGIFAVAALKSEKPPEKQPEATPATAQTSAAKSGCTGDDTLACATPAEMAAAMNRPVPAVLPRMLELGSVGCIPCQKMAPIIEELKKEYAGKLSVEFYDVRQDPAPARQYGIKIIPTQIFLDAQGKEIFRHEGFFPKEEILPILAQMGVK